MCVFSCKHNFIFIWSRVLQGPALYKKKSPCISDQNFTDRNIYSMLSITYLNFKDHLHKIYPYEPEIKEATESHKIWDYSLSQTDEYASIQICIIAGYTPIIYNKGHLGISFYEKCDNFNFNVNNKVHNPSSSFLFSQVSENNIYKYLVREKVDIIFKLNEMFRGLLLSYYRSISNIEADMCTFVPMGFWEKKSLIFYFSNALLISGSCRSYIILCGDPLIDVFGIDWQRVAHISQNNVVSFLWRARSGGPLLNINIKTWLPEERHRSCSY